MSTETTTATQTPDTEVVIQDSSVDWKPLNRNLQEPVRPPQPPPGTKLSQALSSKALAEGKPSKETSAQTSEPDSAKTSEAQDELSEKQEEVQLKEKSEEELAPEEPKSEKKQKRFEKDTERLVKGWETYNAEKAKLDKDKADFEAFWARHKPEMDRTNREIGELREKLAVYEKERPDVVKLDPEAYRQLAKSARAEHDYETEEKYLQQAEKLENELKAWNERQVRDKEDFAQKRSNYGSQVVQNFPEMKDATSALYKKAVEIYNHSNDKVARFFQSLPEGEYLATQIADFELRAAKADALAKENETLRKKLAELNHKTSLSGSVNQPERKQSYKDLPLDQRGKLLRQKIASRNGVLANS